MLENFNTATGWLLIHEGGYVNHPDDPGGATNRGVTQVVYNSFRKNKGLPTQSVRKITDAEVYEIYNDQYWDKIWGDKLPAGLDYALYDFAVNSGPSRAIKFIQRIVGVKDDGVMGNVTYQAIRSRNDVVGLITKLSENRLAWLKTLRHWKTFGKGWTRRIMGEQYGIQERDTGVIDRAAHLYRQDPIITPPRSVDDGASARTDQKDEPIKRTEEIKEGISLDNAAKIGAGGLPGIMAGAAALPEGPLQWAAAAIAIGLAVLVGFWIIKKLK